MKQTACQVVFPVTLFVVMTAFLSAIFFVDAHPAFAATSKAKASTVARTSAVEHTEARIKQLNEALKITEDQEALWTGLTQVMRDNAREMDTLTKDRRENSKAMNAVENMKFNAQVTEARLAQIKKFIPPFEALYTSMSDEQKKVTDTIFRTGRHGKHKFQ